MAEHEAAAAIDDEVLSEQEKKKTISLLEGVREQQPLKDDRSLAESDASSMVKHNAAFTAILDAYKVNVEKSLKQKRAFKCVFFGGVCGILATVLIVTIVVVAKGIGGVLAGESMGVYLTALGTFLTSFIVLPKVIAEYLFHPEEEKGMTDIVKAIQEYDTQIRNSEKK